MHFNFSLLAVLLLMVPLQAQSRVTESALPGADRVESTATVRAGGKSPLSEAKALQLLTDGAIALYESRRVEDALHMWDFILELSPDYPPALHNLGLTCLFEKRWPEAGKCFARLRTVDPEGRAYPDDLYFAALCEVNESRTVAAARLLGEYMRRNQGKLLGQARELYDRLSNRVVFDSAGPGAALQRVKSSPRSVIAFWATYCSVCVQELPALVRRAVREPRTLFVVVCVDGSAARDRAQSLLSQAIPLDTPPPENMIFVHDAGEGAQTRGALLDLCLTGLEKGGRAPSLPRTLFLAAGGQVLRSQLGRIDWTELDVDKIFEFISVPTF